MESVSGVSGVSQWIQLVESVDSVESVIYPEAQGRKTVGKCVVYWGGSSRHVWSWPVRVSVRVCVWRMCGSERRKCVDGVTVMNWQ